MEIERDQQIIVFTDFTKNSKIALNHAIILGQILEKEITIACLNIAFESENELHQKMKSIAGSNVVNTVVLNGNPAKAFNEIVPKINAILAIISYRNDLKNHPFSVPKLLKMFRKSRIPYLFVNKDIEDNLFYKKIILPIDSTKESKEKVLWASYFSRFNEAEVKVMTAHVKDEFFVRQLNNNQKFIRKIFDNFEVNFEIINTMEKEKDIDYYAIRVAQEENAGLVIVLSTKSYGLLDLINGPKELTSIMNKWQIPILCLNPRDDLYVLCD
jgi:nucleotide-binding universal stress UspA family protein